ncbi:MAG: hypothetical protein AB1405_09990 [Bdellovibrionota bacterium]
MAGLRKKLGEILIDMRALRPPDLQTALNEQRASGEKIGEILIRRGMCRSADVLAALEAQSGIPAADLSKATLPHNVQTLLESAYAEKHGIVPFKEEKQGRTSFFHVAFSNPRDLNVIQEVEFKLKAKVKPFVALEGQIRDTIKKIYYAQDYGYDLSFHEGVGFRPRAPGAPKEEAPPPPPPKVMGQPAPAPAPPVDKHPAATSFSDLGEPLPARVAALEAEVERLKNALSALLKVLSERGAISRDDLRQALGR